MSKSPMTVSGTRLSSETFRLSRMVDDVADAYPSIDGAVPKMTYCRPVRFAMILPMSLTTPEPTPRIRSHA